MIVTVGDTKDGVGKTTLAVQLALIRALAGRYVLVVDGNRQGSAQTVVAIRAEAGRMPGLACVQYHDSAVLRARVQRQDAKYDDVVIDAGGRDSSAPRAALALSDLLIVPLLPRSADVWALATIAALVDEAAGVRDGLRACAVLNTADSGASSDTADAAAALADFPQLTMLDPPAQGVRQCPRPRPIGRGADVPRSQGMRGTGCRRFSRVYQRG